VLVMAARPTTEPGAAPRRLVRLEAVLRSIRGVDPETICSELGVTPEELENWRDEFVRAGLSGFDAADPEPDPAEEPQAAPKSAPARTAPEKKPEPEKDRAGTSWREQAGRRAASRLRPADPNTGGLRERKKARTRALIREQAMRLFHEQGYAETTVNQIAEAAEVSPSTFFRYFNTKEDVVFADDAESRLPDTFEAIPPDVGPVRAVFRGLLDAMASTSDAESVRQQVLLCLSVPELRAVLFDNLTQLMNEIAELVAKRVGRDPGDFEVRTFAAAVQGVWYSVLFDWAEDPGIDLEEAMMKAADQLEHGLTL
jgi:Transcriptional regulator